MFGRDPVNRPLDLTTIGGFSAESFRIIGAAQFQNFAGLRIFDDFVAAEEVTILIFTEFGRRMRDNGSGTDHGAGGGAFIVGERINGGLYGEYPPLDPSEWQDGENLKFTVDYRGVYATVLEQCLGLDPEPMVFGSYEQLKPYRNDSTG